MELINNLALGFSVALGFQNILFCLLGVFVGTLIGVLPGIGPVTTLAMLLPITFNLPPIAALIMLAGIYYGAQYGGSTSAILVNLPGESSAVVTCLDGHQMAKQGRARPALAIAALGSFFAGTVATLILATLAPPLAEVAFAFGPADHFRSGGGDDGGQSGRMSRPTSREKNFTAVTGLAHDDGNRAGGRRNIRSRPAVSCFPRLWKYPR